MLTSLSHFDGPLPQPSTDVPPSTAAAARAAEPEVPTTGTTDAEVQSGPPHQTGVADAGEQLEEMQADSVDTGVQPEESIRAGPPCGISAACLAETLVRNPCISPSLLADFVAQRPVDSAELQILRWGFDIAATVERRTAESIILEASGVWAQYRSRTLLINHLRRSLDSILGRPQ